MKSLQRQAYIAVLAVLIFLALAGSYFRVLDPQELNLLDLRFRFRPPVPVTDKVVIIEIDNATIEKLGRFPLDRVYHARLIKALSSFGAKAIVFDIFFSEHKRGDAALKRAMRSAGNVYLPYVFEFSRSARNQLPQAARYSTQNLKDLANLAKGTGFINILPDPDGKFRKIPAFVKYQDRIYPSLAFLVGIDHLGIPLSDLKIVPGRTIAYGALKIPLDEQSNILVNFTGKWGERFRHYSYGEILQSYETKFRRAGRPLDLNVFKDKVCLIGFTADGTTDLHPSPLEPLYPSIGIHAQVFNSLINRQFIERFSRTGNLIILLILSSVMAFASVKAPPLKALGMLLGLNALFVAGSVVLFNVRGLWIDIFYPLFITILGYFACTVFKYISEFKKRIILDNELMIAKRIQESFLPAVLPQIQGFDLAANMLTARQVGGDLYDFLKFDDKKLGVMIGDVTGKGIPASLFMAMVTSSFKFYSKPEVVPQETLWRLNEKIILESPSNLFVTVSYAVFDHNMGVMSYANGGHPPVLYLARNKKPAFLNVEHGLPLGMIKGSYSGNWIKYEKGDIFIFYTDGVTEAVNAGAEMYGTEGLADLVEKNRGLSARQLCEVIVNDVTQFMPRGKQQDDITVSVVKVVG